jgi:hypothetical protein
MNSGAFRRGNINRSIVAKGSRPWVLAAVLSIGVLAPSPAFAHVKWFEADAAYPVHAGVVWSDRTLLWIVSSLAAVGALYLVHRFAARREWPWSGLLPHMAVGAPTILGIQAAIALVNGAVHGTLLAPNLTLQSGVLGVALAGLELLIAASFVTGLADWLGGLVLIALVGVTALLFSPGDALEQLFWAGIGVGMAVVGRGSHVGALPRPWSPRRNVLWMRHAMVVLRVATGVSLITVALTEKIWNPALGAAFLADWSWLNVFQSLPGMAWFSNDVFVLSAGLAEAAIGAMLISGFGTRLVILAMWVPFNLGIPFLPAQELIGHLPILAVMYVLLVQEGRLDSVPSPSVARRIPRLQPVEYVLAVPQTEAL